MAAWEEIGYLASMDSRPSDHAMPTFSMSCRKKQLLDVDALSKRTAALQHSPASASELSRPRNKPPVPLLLCTPISSTAVSAVLCDEPFPESMSVKVKTSKPRGSLASKTAWSHAVAYVSVSSVGKEELTAPLICARCGCGDCSG